MDESLIAKNFKFLLKFHKDKQEILAKMFGVSQSTISEYANGKMPIPIEIAEKIAYRYSITIDDLTSKDLSFEYDKPQTISIEQAIDVGNRMFPFFTSSIAETNNNFNHAYEITMTILNTKDVNTLDSKIFSVEFAIELYKKAWKKSKTYVALSNTISLILFVFVFYSQQNEDIVQNIITKGKVDYFEIQQSLLRDPRKSNPVNKYESKRKVFLDKYYNLVLEYIKFLKSNTKFNDLGDFYLAICYFLGFTDCEYDYDNCVLTALMMLTQQMEIGNKYAEKFLECYFIDNLDN